MLINLNRWTLGNIFIYTKIIFQPYITPSTIHVTGQIIYSCIENLRLKLAEEQTIKNQYNDEFKSY